MPINPMKMMAAFLLKLLKRQSEEGSGFSKPFQFNSIVSDKQ